MARKEKKATEAKVTEKRQQNTHDLMEQTTKSQGKGKGTGKSKSKVTETSESDNSKQIDDWCPSPHKSAQQPTVSQVSAIGCADEGLWILKLRSTS